MADPALSAPFGFQYPPPGPSNVLEYQASGLPFVTQSTAVTSSVATVNFPFVTRFFTIKNIGAGYLNVGFTVNGVQGTNKFSLAPSGSYTADIRVMDLFLIGSNANTSFELIAGLTQIPRKNFFILTGALNGFSGSQEDYGFRGFGYNGLG